MLLNSVTAASFVLNHFLIFFQLLNFVFAFPCLSGVFVVSFAVMVSSYFETNSS